MSNAGTSKTQTMSTATAVNAFDPESPIFVAQAVLSSAALGATIGATRGVLLNQNPFAISINMGINGTVAGLAFFSIREYLVSPLLLISQTTESHTARLQKLSAKQLGKLPERDFVPDLSQVRTDRLLDSGIAGGLSGGILSGIFRGRNTIPRASITAGLIATLLQLSVNSLRVARLQLLANRIPPDASTESPVTNSSPSSPNTSSPRPPTTQNQNSSNGQDSPRYPIMNDPTTPVSNESTSFPARIMNILSTVTPMRKISDQEYLEVLLKKRSEVSRKLALITLEEERLFEQAEKEEQGNLKS